MKRRDFVLSGAVTAAATAVGAQPTFTRSENGWVLPEEFIPRYVRTSGATGPYELHVVPQEFALYWTLPDNKAIRYAVGIGRPGLYEAGTFFVGAKKEWPDWTPTQEMIQREPQLYKKWEDGMPGGPGNPLGARAIYLFTPQKGDTFLRIHGTGDPRGIGREVSNGCARLVNSHAIHLYDQVPLRAKVVLHPKA